MLDIAQHNLDKSFFLEREVIGMRFCFGFASDCASDLSSTSGKQLL